MAILAWTSVGEVKTNLGILDYLEVESTGISFGMDVGHAEGKKASSVIPRFGS